MKGITKAFHDFYVKLFEAKKTDMTKLNEYFQKCGLAKIPEEKKKRINEDITTEEIFKNISALKMGKAPGPDGITALFIKHVRIN